MVADCVPTSSFHPLTMTGSPSARRSVTHGVASAIVASGISMDVEVDGPGLAFARGEAAGEADVLATGDAAPGGRVAEGLAVGAGGALEVQATMPTRAEPITRDTVRRRGRRER